MLLRHLQLRQHVLNLFEVEMNALLLIPVAKRRVNLLIKKLKNLEEVGKNVYDGLMQDSTVRASTLIL